MFHKKNYRNRYVHKCIEKSNRANITSRKHRFGKKRQHNRGHFRPETTSWTFGDIWIDKVQRFLTCRSRPQIGSKR